MKKALSIVLTAALTAALLASCGGKAPSSAAEASTPTQTPVSSTPAPPPEPPYTPNPYTGFEKDSSFPEGQRGVAIMVNNIAVSRPQRGLSMADVLFESKVEGGITRFMALFEDYKVLPDVGPVRSARDQFFRLVYPFQPLYVHIGRSGITQTYIDTVEYGDLNLDGDHDVVSYRRDRPGYDLEHRSYTNGDLIQKVIDKKNIDMNRTYNSPLFDFVKYDENGGERAMGGEPAESVAITHSMSYRTYFDYAADGGRYMMSQYSSSSRSRHKTVDENNGEQLGFENVIVLFAEITTYPYPGGNLDKNGNDKGDPNYQNVHMDDGGVGYYFSKGKVEEIRWQKGAIENRLWFTDLDGNDLKINCGKSYIGMVSLEEHDNGFSYAGPESEIVDSGLPTSEVNEVEIGD